MRDQLQIQASKQFSLKFDTCTVPEEIPFPSDELRFQTLQRRIWTPPIIIYRGVLILLHLILLQLINSSLWY